ncbi:hypothetical protein GXW83_00870 [Streptacidiphilus sp. PB12-B1b]|uniref:PD40 domain-containing protein n=1 Tax=Streptacidiphilus sp. PB12-B1b TaxID=2705012 RepID=UPI0015FB9FC0|nr:PD40 domain-containing protein [Streptacidiphilus sp. PB12-B1b]QMU74548.1 hypothetical protein GXW83_00870 [Streptacidiphilus sp. PB12-B1b]
MRHTLSRRFAPMVAGAIAVTGLSALAAPAAQAALPGTPGLLAGSKILSDGTVTTATENPDGSRLVLHLTSTGGSDQGGGAAWSPDGTSVVYVDGAPAVDTYRPNGTGEEFINDGGADPTYTPDGSTLIEALQSNVDYTTYQLVSTPPTPGLTGAAGLNQPPPPPWFATPTGGSDRYPSVSSSTGAVVFEHDTKGASDIWTDHGNHTAGPLILNGHQPDVSPDGSRIAFYRLVGGYDQLFVQAADGSGSATQVTSGSTNHTYPKWTPDGLGLDYNANPGTDYLNTVGHHLVLASGQDTVIPGGLFSVTQQPTGKTPLGITSTFHSTGPTRVLDTRYGTGQVSKGAVAAGGTAAVALVGANGLPAKGVTAVVLNVTVTSPASSGHLSVYPEGTAVPSTSNLNWTAAGQTISNLVTVPVGADGEVDLTNQSGGSTQVVADLQGYYTGDTSGSTFTSVSPARILDTRYAQGIATTTPIDNSTIRVTVRGQGGVPVGAGAVALNLTAVGTTGAGYLEAYSDGAAAPTVSNVNWTGSGATLAGLAIVPIGADGSVDIKVHGEANVLADVFGYFGGSQTGQDFVGVAPDRLLDTRYATGVPTRTPLPAGHTIALQVTGGAGGVPSGVNAVVLNVTVTDTTGAGHLTAWADGSAQPTSSNLNWTGRGQTFPNQVVVPVGPDGKVDLYVNSSADVIADVFGYYGG